MDQYRSLHFGHIGEGLNEVIQSMPFDGTDILKAQLFEEHPGGEKPLKRLLRLFGNFIHGFSDARKGLQEGLHLRPKSVHESPRHNSTQVGSQGPHIRRDGHLIVVEYHDEVLSLMACLI